MGAFIVIAAISMGVLFLGGVNGRMFLLIAAWCWWPVLRDRLQPRMPLAHLRLPSTLGPEARAGKAYQLTHSLIAFGRGELFGRAWAAASRSCTGCGRTDFLLAVIGEELGFVGVAAVIVPVLRLTRASS